MAKLSLLSRNCGRKPCAAWIKPVRRVTVFLSFLLLGFGALILLYLQAAWQLSGMAERRQAAMALVQQLSLTDLCLTTEARYTRHPSQADRHSAFQDHPLALEHFPSGTVISPPATSRHGQ